MYRGKIEIKWLESTIFKFEIKTFVLLFLFGCSNQNDFNVQSNVIPNIDFIFVDDLRWDELYEIRRERRVELALEGHRAGDYRRWAAHGLFKGKRPKGYPFDQEEFPECHPPLDENGLIDYYQNRLPNGYGFRENQDYLSPIPVEELILNPNLEQNPG